MRTWTTRLLVSNNKREEEVETAEGVVEMLCPVWKLSELLAIWLSLFTESTDGRLYQHHVHVQKHAIGGSLSFKLTVHSSLLGIVLAYACYTGVIIISALFYWQMCFDLSNKLLCGHST